MTRLAAGEPAPDFTLGSEDGPVTLSALRGGRVILFFYPKDATPGCTRQACEYHDLEPRLQAAGARVLGVSPDPVASHARFRARHGLGMTLLADTDHSAAAAYGVWVEKRMYGRTFMGVERSTFVIGPDGLVEHARYRVRPEGDAAAVLALLS